MALDRLLPSQARFALRRLVHDATSSVAGLGLPRRPVFSMRHNAPRSPAAAAGAQVATEHRLEVIGVGYPTRTSVAIRLRTVDLDTGASLPVARPGQFVTLEVSVDGCAHRRAYSLCGDPADRGAWVIVAKSVVGGAVSPWLRAHVRVGDVLTVRGPDGRFGAELEATGADPVVLISGGVGITPLWSMAQARLAGGGGPTLLIAADRSAGTILFRHEIDAAAGRGLAVARVLEQPSKSVRAQAGRFSAAVLDGALAGVALERALFFVCGPAPMMALAVEHLTSRGVSAGRVHTETFSLGRGSAGAVLHEQVVRFTRAGRAISVPAGSTVLEAARAAGVPLAFSCTVGGCAACRVRVTEGRVSMSEPNCLTRDEAAAGYVLACIARPLTPLTLDA